MALFGDSLARAKTVSMIQFRRDFAANLFHH